MVIEKCLDIYLHNNSDSCSEHSDYVVDNNIVQLNTTSKK